MKTVVIKLDAVVDVPAEVTSSSKQNSIPDTLVQLNSAVADVMEDLGFQQANYLGTRASKRNGGWAFYNLYVKELNNLKLELVIDVRTADHPSKPNLGKKNEKRLNILRQDVNELTSEDAAIDLVDAYYKSFDWGAQYYIGKGNSYSGPIPSVDAFKAALKGRLEKLISKYSTM